jgi:hypothetical protein
MASLKVGHPFFQFGDPLSHAGDPPSQAGDPSSQLGRGLFHPNLPFHLFLF